jgi:triacylglycerol lipase
VKHYLITIGLFILICGTTRAACKDNVVLVHGNTASPASWNNTLNELYARGYANNQIFVPNWGSKSCATCNNHNGSEETPVRNEIVDAINRSCTGKIDIIAHSMGVTLAVQQIDKLAAASYVDTFVGIAGALLGLRSCGIYPYNVWNSTCGSSGLSISSPFLDGIYGVPLGDKVYSMKSVIDQVVCSTGTCYVYGIHSSRIWSEDATYTYTLGHFGLQTDTAIDQVNLIQ